jgi:hypothetical protein
VSSLHELNSLRHGHPSPSSAGRFFRPSLRHHLDLSAAAIHISRFGGHLKGRVRGRWQEGNEVYCVCRQIRTESTWSGGNGCWGGSAKVCKKPDLHCTGDRDDWGNGHVHQLHKLPLQAHPDPKGGAINDGHGDIPSCQSSGAKSFRSIGSKCGDGSSCPRHIWLLCLRRECVPRTPWDLIGCRQLRPRQDYIRVNRSSQLQNARLK